MLGLFSVPSVSAQTVASLRLYEQHCATCHGNPSGPKNAPDGMHLRQLSAEAVYQAIAKVPAHASSASLTDDENRLIAFYLGGRKVDVAEIAKAQHMPNQCATRTHRSIFLLPQWNGWGVDPENSRFQPAKAAGLTARSSASAEAEMGFRLSRRRGSLRTADRRRRPRVHRRGYRRRLFARRRHRLRLLVIPS